MKQSAITDKTELAVAALKNGTVIDHVPSHNLFKVVRLLGIEDMTTHVTIGNNLPSERMGTKGIIKVADVEFDADTLSRIALLAPHARINVIHNYEVVEKFHVNLPDKLVGLVRCANPKCITNNEPMSTVFIVTDRSEADATLRCHYCGQTVKSHQSTIKTHE